MNKQKQLQILNGNTTEAMVKHIEEYIQEALKFKKSSPNIINLPTANVISKQEYQTKISSANFYSFAQSAQVHYFVSRTLFLIGMGVYSFFPAQLCVENYLKAFIRMRGNKIPQIHDLVKLLEICRSYESDGNSFINSHYLEAIAMKYAPFSEYPRYPIVKTGPGITFGFLYPVDIVYLDYFVFRMKEIVQIPDTSADILKGKYSMLYDVENYHPEYIELFKMENINFK